MENMLVEVLRLSIFSLSVRCLCREEKIGGNGYAIHADC
jgi:hypothetical protein